MTEKNVFWMSREGMRTAAVPADAVSFGIGAECWHCPREGIVKLIDYGAGHYECSAGHRHRIPALPMRVTERRDAVVVCRNGKRSEPIIGQLVHA